MEPSCGSWAGRGGVGSTFSDVWARACERLLLAVLPALRFPMKLRFEPRPMLSDESATVAPLRPVPVGVASSFVCDDERGIFRNDRFFFGSPSAVVEPSPPCVDREPVLRASSDDGLPWEDGCGGGSRGREW